jgi:hypothetical protein
LITADKPDGTLASLARPRPIVFEPQAASS